MSIIQPKIPAIPETKRMVRSERFWEKMFDNLGTPRKLRYPPVQKLRKMWKFKAQRLGKKKAPRVNYESL